ncbi:MAG: PadR family transcriptional regulator [Acidobacteriota bacterium]|nr:PadR family transcriptional regulator [Acidobacteriota bacterium]
MPTNLGFAILGLLHQVPQSGYDLRKVFASTALGNYSSSPGAIYPALRRLEEKGLVRGREDRSTSLRPRKLYRPTAAGSKIFRGWLRKEIERDDVSRGVDALMLRFAFHSVLEDQGASHRFLVDLAREIEAYLEELDSQKKIFPEQAPIQSRLALDAGIEQYRALVRWARGALEHFKEDV